MAHFNYQEGELWAEKVPLSRIVKDIGTPCYVYSHTSLVENWQAFQQSLPSPHSLFYAVKANSNLAVLQALAQCGAGFDIVSGGELSRVIAAKGDPRKVVFSGVGKTLEEMAFALQNNIFCFNVESSEELNKLNQVASHLNLQAPLSLRVNPDVDPKSHPYFSTGMKETKFGIDIKMAPMLYAHAKTLSHIQIKGVACHIGSQLTSLGPFQDAFKRILALVEQLHHQNIILQTLDMGGGLGIRYQDETPPSPQEYIHALLELCPKQLTLLLEPGRVIVGNAGVLLTRILYLKDGPSKHFCIVDSAMNDLMRPTLYNAWHDITPLILSNNEQEILYDVVGPVCETGDFLGKDRVLAVKSGDILAIGMTGAYGFVMSSNFNTRPRAPEVMVKGTQFKIVRARETMDAILAQETVW